MNPFSKVAWASAARTSMRRNPQVRCAVAGFSARVAAIKATSSPEASVSACAVSVRRARLPVIRDPTNWITTIAAASPKASAIRGRRSGFWERVRAEEYWSSELMSVPFVVLACLGVGKGLTNNI